MRHEPFLDWLNWLIKKESEFAATWQSKDYAENCRGRAAMAMLIRRQYVKFMDDDEKAQVQDMLEEAAECQTG